MDVRFDRVLLIRHFAIGAGGVVAWLLQTELRIGYAAITIVSAGAILNFAAFLFRTRPSLARACEAASPFIGVGSWTALVFVTDGVRSPFIAGLWLEVVFSAMSLRPQGVVYVTVGCVVGLCAQQLLLGVAGAEAALLLQCGFILGMGTATYLVTRRWTRAQRSLSHLNEDLETRLETLGRELEDERALGRLGEGESVGRLAHGVKNAVHSLRGFASLIAADSPGRGDARLKGLEMAIDELEALARLTLDDRPAVAEPEADGTADARAVVQACLQDIERTAPGVVWSSTFEGDSPALDIPGTALREVLDVVVRNAVEAMEGRGKASIEMTNDGREFRTRIRDHGPGLSEEALPHLFEPGYTTKRDGSGYGLFLARRVAREYGGRLSVKPVGTSGDSAESGAVVELSLPLPSSSDAQLEPRRA